MVDYDLKRCICPGLIVAGLCGGSGKTIFSVGIITLLKKLGLCVAPFKKGPDYIDSGWLAMAAGQPCYNLDLFLMTGRDIFLSYQKRSRLADFSVIEGNRGLYDCINFREDTSTAALSKILNIPVILCADVSKSTRTMAAIISGILNFDSKIKIVGVVLNRVAGIRHQRVLTNSIEKYCGVKVLGAIPRLLKSPFPERHMGLVPTVEYKWAKNSVNFIASIAEKYINISKIVEILYPSSFISSKSICNTRVSFFSKNFSIGNQLRYYSLVQPNLLKKVSDFTPIIGVMLDLAFQFYYLENLESLKNEGAKLVFISPLSDNLIPDVDAIYIGGGFPEIYAEKLSNNTFIKESIKQLVENGLPIYAECGGLVYLGEQLIIRENLFEMIGVFPAIFKIWRKPQGHGYTILKVIKKNPYYPLNFNLRGHEFHYSSLYEWRGNRKNFAFLMKKGSGIFKSYDGIFYKNVMATYTHIHSMTVKHWAKSFVNNALKFKQKKEV